MIHFMHYKKIYFLLSALVIVPGLYSLFRWGLRPSIDFTGGTLWELRLTGEGDPTGRLLEIVEAKEVTLNSLQTSGEKTYLLRLPPLEEEKKQEIWATFQEAWPEIEDIRYETVGPILGAELLQKTLIGVFLAAVAILAYVAYQFKDRVYGISAILAMLHDTLILLGTFSLLGHFKGVEVDTLFVTAVLTVLSLSVHDTVVIYGRIRELTRLLTKAPLEEVVDRAIAETLVRSLNNSLTIIFMLLALIFLGGETIRYFAVALLIGAISGTYSSTFVATPVLLVLSKVGEREKGEGKK